LDDQFAIPEHLIKDPDMKERPTPREEEEEEEEEECEDSRWRYILHYGMWI
jgi:hypothetical protein